MSDYTICAAKDAEIAALKAKVNTLVLNSGPRRCEKCGRSESIARLGRNTPKCDCLFQRYDEAKRRILELERQLAEARKALGYQPTTEEILTRVGTCGGTIDEETASAWIKLDAIRSALPAARGVKEAGNAE